MEHFAFPDNIDFAAGDQGAFSCVYSSSVNQSLPLRIIHERLLCLLIVCETMFTIGESRTISHPNDTELQAQQVPANLAEEDFPLKLLWSPLGRVVQSWVKITQG